MTGSGITSQAEIKASEIGSPSKGKSPIALEGSAKATELAGHTMTAVSLGLDRRLTVTRTGLPTCKRSEVEGKTPAQARKQCGDALIGTGSINLSLIYGPEVPPVHLKGSVLFFNAGSAKAPQMIVHRYFKSENAALVTIGKPFVVTLDESGGVGEAVSFKFGRTWTYGGKTYSYLSGPCGSPLTTQVTLDFQPGRVKLSGTVPTRCS